MYVVGPEASEAVIVIIGSGCGGGWGTDGRWRGLGRERVFGVSIWKVKFGFIADAAMFGFLRSEIFLVALVAEVVGGFLCGLEEQRHRRKPLPHASLMTFPARREQLIHSRPDKRL